VLAGPKMNPKARRIMILAYDKCRKMLHIEIIDNLSKDLDLPLEVQKEKILIYKNVFIRTYGLRLEQTAEL
jgi:hypothetical protein